MDNDKKSRFFRQIDEIYAAINSLEKQVHFFTEENPCGDCISCCNTSITIPVTSLDLDYIENRTNNKNYREANFIDFLMKKKPGANCPNFDPNLPGCSIYTSRPIVCRTFGYAPESIASITGEYCCYYKKSNPLWQEMEKWVIKFGLLRLEYYKHFMDTINPKTPSDYIYLAQIYTQNGNIEKAMELYEKVEKIFVDGKNQRMILITRAKKFEAAGDTESAAQAYRKLLALLPTDVKSIMNLVFLEYSLGRHDSSLQYCKEALKYIQTGLLYYTMGLCYFAKEDFKKAIESNDNALSFENRSQSSQSLKMSILSNKAICLERLGRYDESISIFEKVIEMDANNAFAHLSLAINLEKTGKSDQAEKHFKKACEINPQLKTLTLKT